ncbi:MAG TPA: UbiA family prenyltransferase [Turneriella sp.]|nr:UbiA family prenyltransferase [Turneriella sp.]
MSHFSLRRIVMLSSGKTINTPTLLLFCFFTGAIRGILEAIFFEPQVFNSLMMLPYIPFYIAMFLGILILLKYVGGLSESRVYRVPLVALFLGLLPPILDIIISGRPDTPFRYAYYLHVFTDIPLPSGFFVFFMPEQSVPMGEAITVWLTIAFAALYAYLQGANLLRTIFMLIAVYLLFFFHSYILPSLLQTWYTTKKTEFHNLELRLVLPLLQILAAVFTYMLLRRISIKYILKRLLHIAPFMLLLAYGMLTANQSNTAIILFLILHFLLFFSMIVQNDFFDQKEDRLQKRIIHFDAGDVFFFTAITVFTLILLAVAGKMYALFASLILVCGILYSFPFYRAKGRLFATMKFEGLWGALSYLGGLITLAPITSRISNETLVVLSIIFCGWSFFSLFKDIKDVRTDYKTKNNSFYIWFYKKKWGLRKAHHFLMGIATLGLLVPTIYLFIQQRIILSVSLLCITILFFFIGYKIRLRHRTNALLAVLNIYLLFYLSQFYS